MTGEHDGTTRPRGPKGDDGAVREWALERRVVARTIREQAEQMRARTAVTRLALRSRRAAVVDTPALRRRLAVAERRAGNLEVALTSNRRIGMAIGILMARHRLTEARAFDLLRQCSNRRNVKLAALAEDVVHTGELPSVPARPSSAAAGRPGRRSGPSPASDIGGGVAGSVGVRLPTPT
ncbi:ANTAR domain-containing protein [Geodermatophilus sp. SYSU D00815]